MAINVSLPPELERRVRERVRAGLYGSASEVVREALRLFEAYERVQAARLGELQVEIERGLDDVRAGRVSEVSAEYVKQRGRAKLRKGARK